MNATCEFRLIEKQGIYIHSHCKYPMLKHFLILQHEWIWNYEVMDIYHNMIKLVKLKLNIYQNLKMDQINYNSGLWIYLAT